MGHFLIKNQSEIMHTETVDAIYPTTLVMIVTTVNWEQFLIDNCSFVCFFLIVCLFVCSFFKLMFLISLTSFFVTMFNHIYIYILKLVKGTHCFISVIGNEHRIKWLRDQVNPWKHRHPPFDAPSRIVVAHSRWASRRMKKAVSTITSINSPTHHHHHH